MLLTLFDSNGQIKATFSPNDSSTQDKEIQGDNLLKLSFTLYECITIDVNDYLDYDGERYWATEKYTPAQKSTMEWEYSFQLRGVESLISRFLVLNNTDGENEAVFALTARPIDHMRLIVKNINAGMDGLQNFKVGIVEGTDNVVIDYTGKYCQEALKELADAVHTEWWFDGQTLNLCRCEHGEEVTLGYNNGLTSLDRDLADNVKFYTRLFPIGSSRNIDPEKYHHSRLMLPGGAKYVDVNVEKYGIIHHYEQAAFSNIYPRRTGTISEVRHEEVKDKDGKPFTIYYFKDKDLPFDPNDYEIGGLVKRVSFQEGSELAGLGTDTEHYFEVNYHTDTKEFEIITIWPYNDGTQLPGGTLVPKVGDKYILWNLRMPDEYYGIAEQEFLAAVEKYNKEHALDVSRYKAPTDHVWMEDTSTDLFIGRRVRLESNEYFPDTGYRKSRITAISRQVNLPSKMDLEISDALSTGTMQKVEDNIKNVKNYTGTLVGALSVPDIIQSGDTTKPADTNIYSARRSQKEFLSKKEEDVAQQLITFLKGIGLGINGQYSINADGVALLSRILIGNYVKDSSGAGIYADEQGNYHIEGDYFHVRKQLTAEEVQLMKSTHINGKVCNTPGSFTISKVEKIEGGWRCYFTQQDGNGRMISNTMAMDDYAYCETFNLVGAQGAMDNHYYHRRVFGLGTDYVDICDNTNADDYASGSDEPRIGDEVSTLGNKTNPARQHAIIQAAAGSGSPYYRMYVGINSFSLQKPKIQMSPTEGSWWMVTDEHGHELSIEEYLASLKSQINAVEQQSDKQMVLWFGDEKPSLRNAPALEWQDDFTRNEHVNDIYYNRSFAKTGGGRAYTFTKKDSGYTWEDITDADVLTSLEAANRAQDTADGKRRVFVTQPTREQAYDVGDLWVNATYKDATIEYSNDVLRAVVAKRNGEPFSIKHWQPVQQYTTLPITAIRQLGSKTMQVIAGNENTLNALLSDIKANRATSLLTAQGRLNAVISSLSGTSDLLHSALWDDEGNLTGFRNVGILRSVAGEDGSLTLFSDYYDASGQKKKSAELKLTTSEDGAKLLFNADQINFLGKTIINNKFVVDEHGNVKMDGFMATNASISGTVTARKGNIGPFSIGNDGLYTGDYNKWWTDEKENFVYLNSSSFLLEQQVGYFAAGDIAHLMVGFGRGSDPTTRGNSEAYCASAMYIYRRMNSVFEAYRPAAKIISDNVTNRNVALELQGALRVNGGIIEHGYFMEYTKNGDTNVIDFSFATTFLLKNSSGKKIHFFYPPLSDVRKQLGITSNSESFCVPFTIIIDRDSDLIFFSSTCKAATPTTSDEGGRIYGVGTIREDNIPVGIGSKKIYGYYRENKEASNSQILMSSCDVKRFALCFTPSTGYYCVLLSNF